MRQFFIAKSVFSLILILQLTLIKGQVTNGSKDIFQISDSLIHQAFISGQFPGISGVILTQDTIAFYQIGHSNIERKINVSKETFFHLGSLGKLLTAISVVQLVEKDLLDLHVDINSYFEDDNVSIGNMSKPITLHCLLTHSCGLNDINIGYFARDSSSIVSLYNYVLSSYPGLFQDPGEDINYSNYSYALAGLLVEKVSELSFSQYVQENIFDPLAMYNSTLEFPEGYQGMVNHAIGYQKKEEEFTPVNVFPRHAVPAGSLISNATDMALFLSSLYTKDNRLLSPDSWDKMFQLQFSNDSHLNGYSYGFEQQNINGTRGWGKGGMLPGMLSSILIVPNQFAFFYVTNTDRDEFGEQFYQSLFDTFQNEIELSKRDLSIDASKFTGTYRNKRYNHKNAENMISLFRGEFTIYINETSDSLFAFHNGSFQTYIPVEKFVFQNVSHPSEYFIFKEKESGNISLYRNQNIGGLSVPVSYDKTEWYNSPTFINDQYPFVPLFISTGILFVFMGLIMRLVRVWNPQRFKRILFPNSFFVLLTFIILIISLQMVLGPVNLFRNINEFLFGYPLSFKISTFLCYLVLPMLIFYVINLFQVWTEKSGTLFARVYLTLFILAVFLHMSFLYYWNFYNLEAFSFMS